MDLAKKEKTINSCDLYYDMQYTLPYLTFSNIDNGRNFNSDMTICVNLPHDSWSLLFS